MNQKEFNACDRVVNAISKLRNNELDLSVSFLKEIDKELLSIQKKIQKKQQENHV